MDNLNGATMDAGQEVRTGAVAVRDSQSSVLASPMGQTEPASVMEMMKFSIEKGVSPEALDKFLTLHERVTDRLAATEFADALAAFQRDCPAIPKNKTAKISTGGGASYSYRYADLDQIVRVVRGPLHGLGFSYSWDTAIDPTGKLLTATCKLLHRNGHSGESKFTCPTDSSAGMSPQQKFASANSFAKRISLLDVLGINTTEEEAPAVDVDPTPIDAKQVAELEELCAKSGADMARFLNYMGVTRLMDVRKADYPKAKQALAKKAAKP